MSKEEAYTAIEDGDSIYIRINTGNRTCISIKLNYEYPVETLEADYTEHGLREEEGKGQLEFNGQFDDGPVLEMTG